MTTDSRRTIALDAMGGDFAPAQTVEGAVLAAKRSDVLIHLVGDPPTLRECLAAHPEAGELPLSIVKSEGVVEEGGQPVLALRRNPHSSISVATRMVRDGKADACVSMGSTGAAMAAAAVMLGMMEGMERPCLGGPIMGLAPKTVIIDVGTNVDCRPSQLLWFAVIGEVFANQFWGIQRPRVALLSVGAEAGKGNRQVRETGKLLEASGLNFVGNIEGNDLPAGVVDVVVCDGFVGNIVMKLTEGLGESLVEHLLGAADGGVPPEALGLIKREILKSTHAVQARGGGPLLGVNGVSIVGHGRAEAMEVANAIATAKFALDIDFIPRLAQRLRSLPAPAGAGAEA